MWEEGRGATVPGSVTPESSILFPFPPHALVPTQCLPRDSGRNFQAGLHVPPLIRTEIMLDWGHPTAMKPHFNSSISKALFPHEVTF